MIPTKKHQKFIKADLGHMSVTDVPGIGIKLGDRLKRYGYTRGSNLMDKFLELGGEQPEFQRWMADVCGADQKQSRACFYALREWSGCHLPQRKRNPGTPAKPENRPTKGQPAEKKSETYRDRRRSFSDDEIYSDSYSDDDIIDGDSDSGRESSSYHQTPSKATHRRTASPERVEPRGGGRKQVPSLRPKKDDSDDDDWESLKSISLASKRKY